MSLWNVYFCIVWFLTVHGLFNLYGTHIFGFKLLLTCLWLRCSLRLYKFCLIFLLFFSCSKSVFKLSYYLTSTGAPRTARNSLKLAFNMVKQQVNLQSTTGISLSLLDVTSEVKLSHTFGILFSKRIFSSDAQRVKGAVQSAIVTSLSKPGTKWS